MQELVQLGYIITILIGASAFVVQYTARKKQMLTGSKMILQKSMSTFLALILIYNFCDFLSVFMANLLGDGVQWIFVVENVLEIIIIYAILDVERKMADMQKPQWLDVCFAVLAMIMLFGDSIHSFGYIYPSELVYALTMLILNMIPMAILLVYGHIYGSVLKESESKRVYRNLVLYNAYCVFLCIVTTAVIIDQRTVYDFFFDEEIIYIAAWLLFNGLNLMFVWQTCLVYETQYEVKDPAAEEVKKTPQDKLAAAVEAFSLSDREQEIASFLIQGMNNKEIAAKMFLSPNTVKVHASNLYRKLGVSNRVQAVQVLNGEYIEQNETML